MTSVERTITVTQPMARVWDYLSDFTTSEQWDPPTVITIRTSGDGGVGTTYTNTSKFFGREQQVLYVVTKFVPHQKFQLRGDAGSIQLLDTMTFESRGDQTAVTYHAEFTPLGTTKLIQPLLPLALRILAGKVAASLEEQLVAL